ncbi:DUF1016 N-terminal domain-containing protein [Mucilaginibacter sp. KACC 22063]|uniref:DUF1016 N-terminal domain-containing protein n=1 Tax=Mucilaginibacter sp. KACC 22063 TaxID=3025666 RepID=UPI0023653B6F|nr:DUF1016 N-terminal domain-containing protein [Mucilaginibacter sp. KACC 22063]WDF55823.1 DUF1016 N-terminal domain-containing protein [Mucilaginibacter sp. KACC 22063]
MRKEEKNSYAVPKLLISNVTDIIENLYFEIVVTTNARMLSLFWEIGDALNKNQKNGKEVNDLIDEKLSVSLIEAYSSIFSTENLIIMRLLAEKCSQTFLDKISPYISWKYIPFLLELDSEDEWILYIRLVIKEQLQPDQAKQRLVQTPTQDMRLKLKFPDYPFFDLVQPNGEHRPIIENYFNGNEGNAFRPLLEPTDILQISSLNTSRGSSVNDELLMFIASKISDFRILHNHWLNIRFNLLFVNLGRRIKEIFVNFNESSAQENALYLDLSHHLESKFGKLFNQVQLNQSISFAQQFNDHIQLIEFAGLIRWEHILLLIPIKDIDEKFYYARLTAKEGLNAVELNKQIKSNNYKPTNATEPENKTNPLIGQKEESEGYFENEITNSRVVQNIYENNDLLEFMKVF